MARRANGISNGRPRVRLPRRICSLDLETTKTNFDTPGVSTLLFVGTQEYSRSGGGYVGARHSVWLPDGLADLEQYLRGFDGVIVGHNIFKFDYQVLRPHLDLQGIIEKTVDTLALCWWRRWHTHFDPVPDMPRYLSWKVGPELGSLGLDNLSRRNLRSGKTMNPKDIQKVWKTNPKAIYRYNAKDCALTQRLWQHLVRRKRLSILPDVGFSLSVQEAVVACGGQPWISFGAWETWRQLRVRHADIGEPDWLPTRRCPRCGDWRNWSRFDELSSGNDWTDGQIAEWLAGNWGTAYCGSCALVLDWDEDRVSFDLEARIVRSSP